MKDICDLDKAKNDGFSLPYVGLEHVESGTEKFLGSAEPTKVKSSTFKFDSRHVLYGRLRPYLNKVFLPDFEGHCSTEIFPLKCSAVVDRRWLFYWLTWQKTVDSINATCTGARMPRANMKAVLEFELQLPELSEQNRIVAILDEAFAGIETAIANTEKNLANAKELFDSHTDDLLKCRSGAVELRLADCVEKVSTGPFGSLLHKSDYVSRGVPLVNPVNIQGPRIVGDGCKQVDENTLARLSAYILEAGDLVVARRGEIGRCAVVQEAQSGWVCGTGCFFIRPGNKVDPYFLANLLRSPTGRSSLEREATGATMKSLGNRTLSNFKIRLPPREVQKEIVDRVSDLHDLQGRLDAIWSKKLAALAELKQSLLQKAFSGELTADCAGREVESAAV